MLNLEAMIKKDVKRPSELILPISETINIQPTLALKCLEQYYLYFSN